MLVSATLISNATKKYNEYKQNKERYGDDAISGMSTGMLVFFIIIAIVFFVLELLLLFYAIQISFRCTKPGAERIVHLVLAVIFTGPYMLLNIFFGKCGQDLLRSYSPKNRIPYYSPTSTY